VIALFVTLDVRPALRERLLAAITAQAAASREREPGCLQFDVCIDVADPNRVLLYEVYADQAAFEAHGTTPHFAVWRAAADECVEHLERIVTSISFAGRPGP
jgi:autoinducer 2-degrading protein